MFKNAYESKRKETERQKLFFKLFYQRPKSCCWPALDSENAGGLYGSADKEGWQRSRPDSRPAVREAWEQGPVITLQQKCTS